MSVMGRMSGNECIVGVYGADEHRKYKEALAQRPLFISVSVSVLQQNFLHLTDV